MSGTVVADGDHGHDFMSGAQVRVVEVEVETVLLLI